MPNWPSESDLTPYRADEGLPGAGHLLVLAPHPDDEVLGCGGLIARALQRRQRVTVVVVTDGGLGGDAGVRESESRAAAHALAAGATPPDLAFWRLADRGLVADTGLVGRLQHLLSTCDADTVLLPSPFEVHPDHRALCLAGLHALRGRADDRTGWFYEVGQPLMPDRLVDITPVLALKHQAIRCFASQLAQQPYDEQLLSLNRYRAYTLGPAVTHAEAFQRIGGEATRDGMAAVVDDIVARMRRRFDPPG